MFRQIAQPSTTYSACSSLSVVAMATSTRTARRAETGRSDREKRRTLEKQFGLPAPMVHAHESSVYTNTFTLIGAYSH